MDDVQRQALTRLLEQKVRDRDDLNSFISVLSKELGVPEPSAAPAGGELGQVLPPGVLNGEPSAAVVEGQFFGMSAPKATKALLERFGRDRPMKTDEIFAAITKGGVKIGSSGTLYRSLTRDSDFLRVGVGRWGLSEWYPDSARRTARADDDEPDHDSEHGTASQEPNDGTEPPQE